MRQGRVEPVRIMALASARESMRARADLYRCFVLLLAAVATLVMVIVFRVVNPIALRGSPSVVAARWVLGSLGAVTAILAYLSARLFFRRSSALPARRLRIDPRGIVFEAPPARERETLLDFSRPLGVTLLGNRARDRLVLAVTSAHRAVYFGSRVDPDQRGAYRGLLSSASTVSDDDAILDAAGPDGSPFELRLRDMNDLLGILLRADGGAFDRCFLSDTRGSPVVLDGAELRIGRKWFDLRAPLQWKASLFQEPFGAIFPASDVDATQSFAGGVMIYQATWVQQGMSEAVLVSLLGSLASTSPPTTGARGETPEVVSAILRDLRLMQASPGPPPPFELRVGIEHMFMLPLRAALDRAPRPSQKGIPGTGPPAEPH